MTKLIYRRWYEASEDVFSDFVTSAIEGEGGVEEIYFMRTENFVEIRYDNGNTYWVPIGQVLAYLDDGED